MKGLLRKDCYMTLKYCRVQLAVIVVMSFISLVTDVGLSYLMYPMLFAGMIPVYLLSADEKDGWSEYVRALPLSSRVIVTEKYLVSVAAVLAAAVFMLALWLIKLLFVPADLRSLFASLRLVSAIGLLYPAIILPLMLRYGVEKGRFIAAAGVAVVVFAVMFSSGTDGTLGALTASGTLSGVILTAALGLLALSWFIAVRLYESRWARA